MKKLTDIFAPGRTIDDIIADLKVKNKKVPDWADLEKEYEPLKHRIIMEPGLIPDKEILNDDGKVERTEEATRIAIGLQKLSAKLMAQFMFTIPVVFKCEQAKDDDQVKNQFKALVKVFNKNRYDALNNTRCETVSAQCEAAVYWYLVPMTKAKNLYGFSSKYKIKYQIFSPKNNDLLFPLFDGTGDMIAFTRETTVEAADGKKITYVDCWTAEWHYKWQKEDGEEWKEEKIKSESGKIPISYLPREEPVWRDADNGKVHQMEMLLSRNGETIAYNSSPVLILKGELTGAPVKGDGNKVFTTEAGGGAEYVSWNQSAEAVKFQFETLKQTYFSELQLADLSIENVKGLGATSGEARKWLLAGSHLKCGDEAKIYIPAINRDVNIVKALLSKINEDWKEEDEEMDVEVEIKPFTIQSRKEEVEVIVAANGAKKVVSQKTSVALAGLVEDPDAEYEQIKKEAAEERESEVFEKVEE